MKTKWLGLIFMLLAAALVMTACSSSDNDGGTNPSAGTTVQGNVAGLTTASLPLAQAPLSGDVAVVMVDESGNQVSQIVSPADGSFVLDVPAGHDYVMVLREGSAGGKTLGILVHDPAAGRTTFSVGTGDINLGDIVVDSQKGKAQCAAQIALASPGQDFTDSDGDDIPDVCDNSADEDADGVADSQDKFCFDETESVDTDDDGIGDNADADDDNDGVIDVTDAFPKNPAETKDTDLDSMGNNTDADDDNDGVADALDVFPTNPNEVADTDEDGVGDNADLDADNDGIPDAVDPQPLVAMAPLDQVPVPEPVNLGLFLKSAAGLNAGGFPNVDPAAKAKAIQLGKALFWDMNMGSDVQACASCHYQAGADGMRGRNQAAPGTNGTFDVVGPNQAVTAADFPYVQFSPVDEGTVRGGARVRDIDDVMGSQGVFFTQFNDIVLGDFLEDGTPIADPTFNVGGVNTRRVTGRNAPPAVNAVFNYTNFWDGRARNIFNGVNPFGELDPNSGVFVQTGGVIDPVQELVRIPDSSLASQAVGPPGSDVEMTFAGRPFAKIGKKLLNANLKPLTRQIVDPTDSVLGALAGTPTGLIELVAGENAYVTLIKEVFQEKYWNSPDQHITFAGGVATIAAGPADPNATDQYTMMEANFSLFFGLAVQIYEATLVSDDTKFDRVLKGLEEFTAEEKDGFTSFFGGGHCSKCHTGPLFTNHTIDDLRGGVVPQAPGFLPANAIKIGSVEGGNAFIDTGFVNIAVRPTAEDLGWGGSSPFINPLTSQPFPLAFAKLALLKRDGLLPDVVAQFVPDLPGAVAGDRVVVDGTFKVAGLRNVELTGPYFHNGSTATLMQVVEFYTRMGNFPQENILNVDPDFQDIGQLRGAADKRANLVKFLLTLTDERVKFEKAPFDHPQFLFPAGDGLQGPATALGFATGEGMIELPAVGAAGRVEPLQPFLGLNPLTP